MREDAERQRDTENPKLSKRKTFFLKSNLSCHNLRSPPTFSAGTVADDQPSKQTLVFFLFTVDYTTSSCHQTPSQSHPRNRPLPLPNHSPKYTSITAQTSPKTSPGHSPNQPRGKGNQISPKSRSFLLIFCKYRFDTCTPCSITVQQYLRH